MLTLVKHETIFGTTEWWADVEAEQAMVEAGKPVFEAAARITGWDVSDIAGIHPNGMRNSNTRVFRVNGEWKDVTLTY